MSIRDFLLELPPEFDAIRPFLIASPSEPFIRVDAGEPRLRVKHPQDDRLPRRSSKMGGLPYFPKSADYPRDEAGIPLVLLAQIDCAEVPIIPNFDFPDRGLLQFYIYPDPAFCYPDDKHRVLYFPETDLADDELLQDFSFIKIDRPSFAEKIRPLSFAADEAPFWQTHSQDFLEQLKGRFDREFVDNWYDWMLSEHYDKTSSPPVNKLGGYPCPRGEMDDLVLGEMAEKAAAEGREVERLLLEFEHPDNISLAVYFFIQNSDLRSRNFDRVLVQCFY